MRQLLRNFFLHHQNCQISHPSFGTLLGSNCFSRRFFCITRCSKNAQNDQNESDQPSSALKMIKVRVKVLSDGGKEHTFLAPSGMTLMEAIRDVGKLDMEAACDGTCACSTCHVIMDGDSFSQIVPNTPSEDEMDMLDLAPSLSPTSRLACQVQLSDNLQDISLTIPDDG